MPATYDLSGRVAFITGAAQSIGAACAKKLAESGAAVAVADLNLDGAREQAAAIEAAGGRAVAVHVDVADPASVDAAVAATVEQLGGLHIGVNNAGVTSEGSPTADLDDATWRRILSINLDGVFHCTRAELRVMRDAGTGGSIVNMASILGAVAFKDHVAYTAAKHGVVGLTKGAAVDHAADGIRVNAVAPAFVRTPLVESSLSEEEMTAIAAAHPLGRMGELHEVAELVCWLASDAASFSTGTTYTVDGGYTAV